MASNPDSLVLSKSLALVERTKRQVAQIDSAAFPTTSSEHARKLLLDALETMSRPENWGSMDTAAFYRTIIQLQDLVKQVEASSSSRVAWPLVSYCDDFWSKLFPGSTTSIFYSVFDEHNYGISSFTERIRRLLRSVLPEEEISTLIGNKTIYCLQIASLEDENLPLYANIGHEFGHALFHDKEAEILDLFRASINQTLHDLLGDFSQRDPTQAQVLTQRSYFAIKSIAVELFCDAVGCMIAGPAFAFSLDEMGWGAGTTSWPCKLSPKAELIRTYPSFAFRLHCVKSNLDLASFEANVKTTLDSEAHDKDLCAIAGYPAMLPADHSFDRMQIKPESDSHAKIIREVLDAHLPKLKTSLEEFITSCKAEILNHWAGEFPQPSGTDVASLICRLEADVLPNIVPDGTLLGRPGSFSSILNASALFRTHHLLTRPPGSGPKEIDDRIQKLERLTAKAFEVSYIQNEFKNWQTASNAP